MGCSSLLKCFIYISVILVLIIGAVFGGIFIKVAMTNYAEAAEMKTEFIVIAVVFLIIMIAIALLGLCGVYRANCCCLLLYAIILAALFVGFWIVFTVMKKGKSSLNTDMENLCNKNEASGFAGKLNSAYPSGIASFFCSNSCPCKADRLKFTSSEYASAIFSSTGASMITQCPTSIYTTTVSKAIFGLLGMLEEEFKCSGICEKQRWFYFSDVNRGVPTDRCYQKFLDYVNKYYNIVYGIDIACVVITFLAAISTLLYICCNDEKKKE